ncbi:MAG: archease [Patescibacteria group bacterium]|nr:archease [Patescibacteria group bacterium]
MPYSFLEHTADVRMKVEDGTLPGLFVQALLGMFAFMHPTKRKVKVMRHIIVRSSDSTALLVDFLNEVLYLAQSNKETYDSIHFNKLVQNELRAQLNGYKAASFGEDIKAVTYHEAKITRNNKKGWRAQIIFDI